MTWAYLTHDFLRDACLVDENFYDDYFVQSTKTKKKKSRPFACFKSPDMQWLFLLPHTNKTVKESRHYRRYVVELNDCLPGVANGNKKKWSADFSRSFRVPVVTAELWIHRRSDADLKQSEWELLEKRMVKHVEECELNKDKWAVRDNRPGVNFLDLHANVAFYQKSINKVLPWRIKKMKENGLAFDALIKHHKKLLLRFDAAYTDFAIYIKSDAHSAHAAIRSKSLQLAREMVRCSVKIAASSAGFFNEVLVQEYKRLQAELAQTCTELESISQVCKTKINSKT